MACRHDATEFAQQVNKLLANLHQELVSVHESTIIPTDSRSYEQSSSGAVRPDEEAFMLPSKLMCQEVKHYTASNPTPGRTSETHSDTSDHEDKLEDRDTADREYFASVEEKFSINGRSLRLGSWAESKDDLEATAQKSLMEERLRASMVGHVVSKLKGGSSNMSLSSSGNRGSSDDLGQHSNMRAFKSVLGKVQHLLDRDGDMRNSAGVFLEAGLFFCSWSIVLYLFVLAAAWNDTLGLVDDWKGGAGPLGRVFDWMVLTIFVADILINFNTSFEDARGIVIVNRKEIVKHYLKGWFVFDVLVSFPYDFLLSDSGARSARFGKIGKSLKLFRLLKIIRASSASQLVILDRVDDKLSRKIDYSLLQGVLKRTRLFQAMFRFCLLLFCQSHVVSCLLLLAIDDGTRLDFKSQDVEILTPWLRFIVVFKWALVGCGTGITNDNTLNFVVPHMDPQLIKIGILFVFAANTMVAFSLFSSVRGGHDMDLSYRLRMLAIYLRKRHNVSRHSRNAVVQFHKSQAARGRAHEITKLLASVPQYLKQKIAFETYAEHILQFALFRQGPLRKFRRCETFLLGLCNKLEGRFYISREVVIAQKHSWEGMCCRIEGSMVITTSDEELMDGYGRLIGESTCICPDFFGVEAIFAPKTPSWQTTRCTVMSVNQSEVALLTRKDFDEVLEGSRELKGFFSFVRSKVSKLLTLSQDLASIGIAEEFETEFKNFSSGFANTSAELGMSESYILCNLTQDLISETNDVDIDAGTFMTLKDIFWGEDHRGFLGSASKVCPRDGQPGSAIVDAVDPKYTGKATHFVSWCWRYSVKTVVSALQEWTSDHNETNVFFWMCFFCNNQRSLLIEGDPVNLVDTFGQRLEKIGNMIVLLDRYDSPFYTTRLWCIFESYTATVKNIPVKVALPTESLFEYQKVVTAPFGFLQVMRGLAHMDTEAAEASVKADETTIRNIISSTIGFQAVNATVKAAITRWLASAFEQLIGSDHVKMSSMRPTFTVDDFKKSRSEEDTREGQSFSLERRNPGMPFFIQTRSVPSEGLMLAPQSQSRPLFHVSR